MSTDTVTVKLKTPLVKNCQMCRTEQEVKIAQETAPDQFALRLLRDFNFQLILASTVKISDTITKVSAEKYFSGSAYTAYKRRC